MAFRALHASDLHLGASFGRVAGAVSEDLVALARKAPSRAWRALVDEAKARGVDFVLLAGDTLDREAPPSAREELLAGLTELSEAGVVTVIAAGEHDPAGDAVWKALALPADVHLLTDGGEPLEVVGPDGSVKARLHLRGASDVDRPAASSASSSDAAVADIAVADIGVARMREEGLRRLASRMAEAKMDLWLLGGEHRPLELREEGVEAFFPGNLQGLGFRESGPRGCLVVDYDGGTVEVEALPLAPVVWDSVEVDTKTAKSAPTVRKRALAALRAAVDAAGSRPEALLLRLVLTGEGPAARSRAGAGLDAASLTAELEGGDATRVEVVTIERRPAVEAALRSELHAQGGFAAAVLHQIEGAREPGVLRRQLLNVLRAVWEDRQLMADAGLEEPPDVWLERLLPEAARRAAGAIGHEAGGG